jgi:hypothetical protein
MLLAPIHHDAVQLLHAIGQRGRAGLQDVGRFDLEQLTVLDRIHFAASPRAPPPFRDGTSCRTTIR